MDQVLAGYKNIMAFTGHRPNKLGNEWDGSPLAGPVSMKIWNHFRSQFVELGIDCGISGLALGTDMIAADAILSAGIDLVVAVPFRGQEKLWTRANRVRYFHLINQASLIYVVDIGRWVHYVQFMDLQDSPFSGRKMQARNEWMVRNSTILSAVYDGTSGGTQNCLIFARKWQEEHPDYQVLTYKP